MNPSLVFAGLQLVRTISGLVADYQAGKMSDEEFMTALNDVLERNKVSHDMLDDAIARSKERNAG